MNNNYELIQKFTQEVSMGLLLKLLEKDDMKGPALSLIYNAYLRPSISYKPNIFHHDYDKICEKGRLLARTVGDEADKLIHFIVK